jgi:hypothetical protein
LPEKKALSIKQANLRDMFKKASKCVLMSTVMVFPDLLTLIPSTSLAMKNISEWNTPLTCCAAQE